MPTNNNLNKNINIIKELYNLQLRIIKGHAADLHVNADSEISAYMKKYNNNTFNGDFPFVTSERLLAEDERLLYRENTSQNPNNKWFSNDIADKLLNHLQDMLNKECNKQMDNITRRAAAIRQQAQAERTARTDAATKLQKVIRGIPARRKAEEARTARDKTAAATKLQKVIRGSGVRRKAQAEKIAATTIQSLKRGIDARKIAQEARTAAAATKLQKVIRGSGVRRKAQAEKIAATTIQSLKRGIDARRQAQAERTARDKTAAATTIQRLGRGMDARRKTEEAKTAVKTIQSIKRGIDARRQAQAERTARDKTAAATTIQRLGRGSVARRKTEEARAAVKTIQRLGRGMDARRQAQAARTARTDAATNLQSFFRGIRTRRIQNQQNLATRAAAKIQLASRRRVAVAKLNVLKAAKAQAVVPKSTGRNKYVAHLRRLKK